MAPVLRARGVRALLGATAALGLATAVIGFAHTTAGRPLLAYLPGLGGKCPVGMDVKLTPAERDAARGKALASVRGDVRAAERPALGFTLDATTRGDVEGWAAKHGIGCEGAKRGQALRCSAVPAASVGSSDDVDDLLLVFDGEGRLVSADASRRTLTAEAAAALVQSRGQELGAKTGAQASESGTRTASYLSAAPLRRAAIELRCADHRAQVSATNVGSGRVLVREEYQSIPN